MQRSAQPRCAGVPEQYERRGSRMLKEIFSFEVRYHLRQPLIYICAVLFALITFGAVTSDGITIGGSIGNVHRNAPYVIMRLLAVIGIFGIFTTTAFVGNAAYRDFELNTDSLFFSSPIRKRDYLLGRFTGSVLISFLIFVATAGAVAFGSLMPWLDKQSIGPFHVAP